jgi:hypothetical protein
MARGELLFVPAHIYPAHIYFPDLPAVVAWCGLLLFGLLLLYAWRGGHDFLILIHRGKVSFTGKFPASKRADVTQLLEDLKPEGKIRISGKWTEQRVLRVSVSGPIQEGQRQQIRNYIKLALNG